jgi:hypothetical protein
VASLRYPDRNCAAVSVSAHAHTALPSKEFADRGVTLDAATASPSLKVSTAEVDSDGCNHGAHAVIPVKRRRHPLIGVRNSASLPISLKKERFKALFISRFSPEVTDGTLKTKMLVCLGLKTKFNTYASFHVSVI